MACHYDCFFINGVWVKPHSDDVISLENPATGEVFAHVPDGTPEDVANAIEAAAQAQPAWAATPLCQRIERMQKALEIFRTYREEIIRLEALELGSPVSFSANSLKALPLWDMAFFSSSVRQAMEWENPLGMKMGS